MNYFFSLQYSAIQKTVLRHNRLWSIAGISQGLSRLNEIDLPAISTGQSGTVMVAGGGKFTVYFNSRKQAEEAKTAIIRKLTTSFPMLEFQNSEIIEAIQFKSDKDLGKDDNAKNQEKDDSAKGQGIIEQLNDKKHQFRGYAVTYLPHLAVCEECGEYPAETCLKSVDGKKLCRTCHEAWESARIDFNSLNSAIKAQTTLERIYSAYLKKIRDAKSCQPVYNFDDLFPKGKKNGKESANRMAVWFSDLNNMNQKVPIWLDQPDDKVLDTFNVVKNVNIAVVAESLARTFPDSVIKGNNNYLPFRLVVAGGDDLCLVMSEEYILDFADNLDQAVRNKIKELDQDSLNPLNMNWLNDHAKPDRNGEKRAIGPFSFGSSFVITSIHTPFKRIHEIGEKLMKEAKEETGRLGNSINWRIMAEDEANSDNLLEFERWLFISKEENKQNKENVDFDRLSLADYLDLRKRFSGISSSHRYAIIGKLIELRRHKHEHEFEDWLKCYDSGEKDKSFSGLLKEPGLRRTNKLVPARIATLFELLGIKTSETRSMSHV